MATYEHCYVCNWVLLLLHSQIQPDRRTVLCHSCCSASGVGTAVTSHSLPCPRMEGRAACCLLCCTLVFGFLGWVMLSTKPSQAECVLLLGKNNQKKARGDSSSSLCWVAYKVSRVYWLLGCFCICFNLQLADMGRLGCWSLIPEVPVSVQWVSLSCPFVEEQEPGLTVEHFWCQAAQHGRFCVVPGTGLSVAKQHQCWAARSCLLLILPLQSPGELSLLLALPYTEFQAVGRQQLLAGTGEMEGDGCEVDHQTHLPCTGGTIGLSPEQSSPSQAPLASSSNRSAPHPLSGKLWQVWQQELGTDLRGAAFRQPALPSLLSRSPSLWLVLDLSSFPPALPLFTAFR